jgi:hypothetical protein
MGGEVLAGHLGGHLLHVLLALDVDTRDAGQVDDGQVGSVIGVDAEFDGVIDDLSALASHFVGQLLDIGAHFCEVGVLLSCGVVLEDGVGLAVGFAWMEGGVRGSVCTRRSSKGRRVTTPDPLGRKSRPTIFSRSELLPLDCVPSTAILGREISLSSP